MDEEDSTPQQSGEASLANANSSSSGPKKTSNSTSQLPSRKKLGRNGQQEGTRKPQSSNNNNQAGAAGASALSREDRKTAQIMQMIERQENLLKRRERKKERTTKGGPNGTGSADGDNRDGSEAGKGSAGNGKKQNSGMVGGSGQHDRNKNGTGQGGGRNSAAYLNGKAQNGRLNKPAVEIHVFFSDEAKVNPGSQRFFFERKQRIEEKQRQEYEEQWARSSLHTLRGAVHQVPAAATGMHPFRQAFSQQTGGPLLQEQVFMHQIYGYPVPSVLSGQQYLEVMNPHHYAEDDYGSSYFSSASKRQRIDEAGNAAHLLKDNMPMQELLYQQSVHLFPTQSQLMPMSSTYGAAPQQLNQGESQLQEMTQHQCHQEAFLYFQENNKGEPDLQQENGMAQRAPLGVPVQIDNKKEEVNQTEAVSGVCEAAQKRNNNGTIVVLPCSSQSEEQVDCASLENLEQYNAEHQQQAHAKTKANSVLGEDGKVIEVTTTPAVVEPEKEPAETDNQQQRACGNTSSEMLDVQRIIELTRQIQAQRRPLDV